MFVCETTAIEEKLRETRADEPTNRAATKFIVYACALRAFRRCADGDGDGDGGGG